MQQMFQLSEEDTRVLEKKLGVEIDFAMAYFNREQAKAELRSGYMYVVVKEGRITLYVIVRRKGDEHNGVYSLTMP